MMAQIGCPAENLMRASYGQSAALSIGCRLQMRFHPDWFRSCSGIGCICASFRSRAVLGVCNTGQPCTF